MTHPASTTAANLTPEERSGMGISDGLVRLSIGLEHPDDIVADVVAGLAAVDRAATPPPGSGGQPRQGPR